MLVVFSLAIYILNFQEVINSHNAPSVFLSGIPCPNPFVSVVIGLGMALSPRPFHQIDYPPYFLADGSLDTRRKDTVRPSS